MLVSTVVILVCTLAIWWCSERLSHGTDAIGTAYAISPGVRGATLDAVASSFPEFCTVVFALFAGAFDAGVGAVAGSALFNILVIPALASLAVGGLVVRSAVVKRDGVLYTAVVLAFIVVFWLAPEGSSSSDRSLSLWVGLGAIIVYVGYVTRMVMQAKAGDEPPPAPIAAETPQRPSDVDVRRAVLNIVIGMAGVGLACHYLVIHGLHLVSELGFSAAVAGVTILAAATSLPDTLLSVFAARRGDADGAIANAFASNTFDILICLGLPIFISGGLEMNWDQGWPILVCLFISTIAAVVLMITDWKITVFESVSKLALYVLFCVAVFAGWL